MPVRERPSPLLAHDLRFVRALRFELEGSSGRHGETPEMRRGEDATRVRVATRATRRPCRLLERTHEVERPAARAAEAVDGQRSQLVFAAEPRAAAFGPSFVGRMSKSKIPIGR